MTSGFKKIIIISFSVFVVFFILAAGVIFFPKERNQDISDQDNQQGNYQFDGSNNKTEELTEEERVKNIAESFAIIRYSYAWGNFSNIESQYYYMTGEMKNREERKVIEMKKETENQPQKYFTAKAKLIDSNFIYYEKERAAMNINLTIDNFAGAIAQRDTMVWVNEKGDRYTGDLKDLIVNTASKNIEINLIKIGGEWKISEVEEK
jgi:hypothetical protein